MRIDPAAVSLTAGFILDWIFGDPKLICHPVILAGKLIAFLEKKLRPLFPATKRGERIGGGLLTVCTIIICTGIPAVLLLYLYHLSFYAGLAGEIYFCFRLLAVRSMKNAADDVYRPLKKGDLPSARKAVSAIVGRDTERLNAEGIAKAAIESVAESTSDGIIAPVFFFSLFGAAGGCFYKSINTMDSMIGYRNDRYRYFGTCAARMDDIVNFIPARLSGIYISLAAAVTGHDGKNAWKIFLRDHRNHKSPNSACGEAAMAGALGIRLGGNAYYFGELVEKPTIGDARHPVSPEMIRDAEQMMSAASVIGVCAAVLLRIVVFRLWL